MKKLLIRFFIALMKQTIYELKHRVKEGNQRMAKINFNHLMQGATSKKTSFKSLYLSHIVDVEIETAGSGLDDSEITVTYMKNTLRTSRNKTLDTIKFEFPKKADILPLYKMLGNLVMKNRYDINNIVEK